MSLNDVEDENEALAKIERLEAAFARGDYARVSKEVGPLAAATKNSDVQTRAKRLRDKLAPEPTAKVLFIIAAVLLAAMTLYFEMRSR